MKLTRRAGESRGGIFSVGVRGAIADRFEDALTYLEEFEEKTASQIVIELVMAQAKRQGWTGQARHTDSEDANNEAM